MRAWRIFSDRIEAGQDLAKALAVHRGRPDVVVLGLPRGGVPVAFEVARFLGAPLDVLIVRKLGVPGHTELAMGAIATGGIRLLNDEVIQALQIPMEQIDRVAAQEQREMSRREMAYRGDRPPLDLRGHVTIVVDDGMATGSTMRAAVQALQRRNASKIVVAVPHAPADTVGELRAMGAEVVCLEMPEPYFSVGSWYREFPQVDDAEVRNLMKKAGRRALKSGRAAGGQT
ncbi:MAG: phosphoribosyltransferase [Gammaproteobacteria bacterium]|nr:phosphoribosyltransferase [Gammaproteobacteria bacterium]